MNCQDIVALLTDYLEGRMEAGPRLALERHLDGCPPCLLYLRELERAINVLGDVPVLPPPPEVRDELMKLFDDWRLGVPRQE